MPHTDINILLQRVADAGHLLNNLYYHHSNPDIIYKVVNICIDEATEEVKVLYLAPYGIIWARKYEDFISMVTKEDGSQVSRFIQHH